jgi:hypothetical protein
VTRYSEPDKKPKKWGDYSVGHKWFMVISWVVLAMIIIGSFLGMNKTSKNDAPTVKASYETTIGSSNVIDPATISIAVKIRNISSVAGSPRCSVSASNASGTYKGYDYFSDLGSIEPSKEGIFAARLTITNEGAQYITKANATCE